MLLCETIKEVRKALSPLRKAGKRIGFLPTMGALHEGHLSLARALRQHCDIRVCSIFVNPTQFNDPKDYQMYQLDLQRDKELLKGEGIDLLFAPQASEVYPEGFQTAVTVSELSKPLEGRFRPGHFQGVATVVTILFNIVQPDVAIFGEKDFQQLALVEQMVKDLALPISIVRGALIRDCDGLALSSRNARLTVEGRKDALFINKGLQAAVELHRRGEGSSDVLEATVAATIGKMRNPEIDYIEVVDESSLQRVPTAEAGSRILVVARVEGVRLLDNVRLEGA